MADDPKRRGRPPKSDSDRLVPLTTNVRRDDYDALCRRAQERGKPVSEFVREVLTREQSQR